MWIIILAVRLLVECHVFFSNFTLTKTDIKTLWCFGFERVFPWNLVSIKNCYRIQTSDINCPERFKRGPNRNPGYFQLKICHTCPMQNLLVSRSMKCQRRLSVTGKLETDRWISFWLLAFYWKTGILPVLDQVFSKFFRDAYTSPDLRCDVYGKNIR